MERLNKGDLLDQIKRSNPARLGRQLLLASIMGLAACQSAPPPRETPVSPSTPQTIPGDLDCYGRYGLEKRVKQEAKSFDELAQTPPMGWNGFNGFGYNVNEKIIKEVADAMSQNCMREAGYEYINLDEGWQSTERNPDGTIKIDTKNFPGGIKELTDYVHSKGLKFGIYTSVGSSGCQTDVKRAGSYNHEEQDVKFYASWGVDFLKIDWCGEPKDYPFEGAQKTVKLYSDAIKKSGRPMVLSISCGGCATSWKWPDAARPHMWRVGPDIHDQWDGSEHSVLGIINQSHLQESIPFSGPGRWSDADMLRVGNKSLTETEARSHFSVWAITASPLIAGNDVRNMSQSTKDILLNGEVIAINQDRKGRPGTKISDTAGLQIWVKELENSREKAILLFNSTSRSREVNFAWKEIGLPGPVVVRDLWNRKDLGSSSDQLKATIEPKGVIFIKASSR
ncbi:MAG: glycoside hydrolase family 27 protein [Candidatus Daviesbacteria bacterium]|nr:glycoside hydrolase family 27 protein [Candidatus Daviesbacteria bacterium]